MHNQSHMLCFRKHCKISENISTVLEKNTTFIICKIFHFKHTVIIVLPYYKYDEVRLIYQKSLCKCLKRYSQILQLNFKHILVHKVISTKNAVI